MNINQAKLQWIWDNNKALIDKYIEQVRNQVWELGEDSSQGRGFNRSFLLDIKAIINNENFNNISCKMLKDRINGYRGRQTSKEIFF